MPEVPIVRCRLHRPERRPSADRRQSQRQGNRKADQLDRQLDHVDPRRREQAAGGEIDRDQQAAQDAAEHEGDADDGGENRGDGDQLPREDEDGADPQQRGNRRADLDAEAILEKVADRAQVAPGGDAAHGRPDPQRQRDRSDRRRSHPPDSGETVAIPESGGPHGGTGPDVRREHRRENQARPEAAAGNEEVRRSSDPAADPQAERDLRRGIDDQQGEVAHVSATRGREARRSASDRRAAGRRILPAAREWPSKRRDRIRCRAGLTTDAPSR